MTDLRKQANRMMFNQAEDEFVDGEDTIGLGVIGKEGSGRLRAVAAQQRQKLRAKAQKKVRRRVGGEGGRWLVRVRVLCCRGALELGKRQTARQPRNALGLPPYRPYSAPPTLPPSPCLSAVCAEELRQQRGHQRPVLLPCLHTHPGH